MISLIESKKTAGGDIYLSCYRSIVLLSVGDNDKPRDETVSLKKSVKFYGSLCLPEPCPWKDRQAKLEERRIEDVELPVKFEFVLRSKRGYSR